MKCRCGTELRVIRTASTDAMVGRINECVGKCGFLTYTTETTPAAVSVTFDTSDTSDRNQGPLPMHGVTLTQARAPETEPLSGTEKIGSETPIVPLKPAKCSPAVNGLVEFDIFWGAYPRKTGKGAAKISWLRHKPPLKACLEAIRWQAASKAWLKDGGDFIPMPATWINQERWNDEPPTKSRAPDLAPYHAPVKEPAWMQAMRDEDGYNHGKDGPNG